MCNAYNHIRNAKIRLISTQCTDAHHTTHKKINYCLQYIGAQPTCYINVQLYIVNSSSEHCFYSIDKYSTNIQYIYVSKKPTHAIYRGKIICIFFCIFNMNFKTHVIQSVGRPCPMIIFRSILFVHGIVHIEI